jgi:hypothetical protein
MVITTFRFVSLNISSSFILSKTENAWRADLTTQKGYEKNTPNPKDGTGIV